MTLLDTIGSGKAPEPRRTLLYAVHGWGKSTFASQSPGAIFIPTERGLADIPCSRFFQNRKPSVCQSFEELKECLMTLGEESHAFRTVVIDTADWMERLIWQDVARARNVDDISKIDFGRGYEFAIVQWREVLTYLDFLRDERQMDVLLLAHSKVETCRNPETDSYDRYSPRLHKHASHLLQEWCDEVLFGTYKVYTSSKDEGFNKKRTTGIGTGERVIRTCERPAHLAKNRLSLPAEIPLPADKSQAWATYAQHLVA